MVMWRGGSRWFEKESEKDFKRMDEGIEGFWSIVVLERYNLVTISNREPVIKRE